jgi:hypothetical protein
MDLDVLTGTWTSVTSDTRLVHHLLDLYFCWEYPTLASLSREHFLADFAAGRPRFCSPLLVNALLAIASRFSDNPGLRAESDRPHTAGDGFFGEARRLFGEMRDHHSLTTIQALGIMGIRQASCGRETESRYYAGQSVRLCIEMGLHNAKFDGDQDDEHLVQLATFWGAFALDQYVERKPQSPSRMLTRVLARGLSRPARFLGSPASLASLASPLNFG